MATQQAASTAVATTTVAAASTAVADTAVAADTDIANHYLNQHKQAVTDT